MAFQRVQVDKGIRQIGPNRWEVVVHVGRDPVTGKLRQVSRTTRKGIADARKLRARLITEVKDGGHGGTAGTLGALLDAWLEHLTRLGRSPSTMAEYKRKVDAAIRPALGARRLDKLTARDLDTFYWSLTESGLSARSVLHHHRIISAALNQGVRWGWVPTNVAVLATPLSVPPSQLKVPPPERVRALIDLAAASKSPETATMIVIAALTGLRRGELCGLRWADVDWQGSSLTVSRSVWQTGGEWGVKAPKTHQHRRLLLGEHAMAVLAGRRKRVDDACALAEVELAPDAYIFSRDIDGVTPILPSSLTLAFSRLCKAMAKKTGDPWPYRLHDLRHYTATELFRAGVNPRTVADQLGHADPSITMRVYVANTDDQARAAGAALEAGLTG